MKNQKGIGIVALMLTIIVMIILAAIMINIAMNGGFDINKSETNNTNEVIQQPNNVENEANVETNSTSNIDTNTAE